MAFKASTSRAPAAPSMYRIGTDKFYGIDTGASDDNISLSRACGISYFNAETSGKNEEPGLINFIRTNVGEIGKRPGMKPVVVDYVSEYEESISQVKKSIFAKKHLILATVDGEGNHERYSLHIFTAVEDKYIENVIEIGKVEEQSQDWKLLYTTDNHFFAGSEGGVILGKLDNLPNGLVYITSAGICTPNVLYERYFYFDYGSKSNSYHNVIGAGIKIPTVFIGRTAAGEGVGYEPLNEFTNWVCEQYQGDGTSTEYPLSFAPKTYESPKAFILSENGEWKESKVSFSENKISFETAPSKPVITGEDNVKIYYCRESESGVKKMSNCTIACNYGVAGYKDRLWLTGNDDKKNYVFYSAMDDYTYFPETSYLTFGDEGTEIKMLSGQDSNLAVFTSDKCYLVSGTANSEIDEQFESDALFTVSHIFESIDPVKNTRPIVFNNEVVYLSKSGLAAITPSNVLDERCAQIRSERANYWLLQEDIENAKMCVCKDFLVFMPGNSKRIYLFDGIQYSATASKPTSYRQYEGYIWQSHGFGADHIWSCGDKLYLYKDGCIYYLPVSEASHNEDYTDKFILHGNEENQPVCAVWETPNIYGNTFYAKKSFARLGILLRKSLSPNDNKEINTSVKVLFKKNNEPWKLLKDYSGEQTIFRYDYINYDLFSYRDTGKTYDMNEKIKIKKAQSLKLRFENDIAGMPLFLQAFGLEYTF